MENVKYYSVSAINRYIYHKFDVDVNLQEVYVKGEIKSLGNNAKFDELTFQDSLELEEVLSKYEFDIDDYSKFKKIVPKSTRPFYGH